MIKKGDIKKYYNSQASIKVLSNICKNPKLLNRGEYKLDKEDFIEQFNSYKKILDLDLVIMAYYEGK